MDILEAMRRRQSIRGFKPDPVSRDTIARILTIATRSPSARNTQPWEVYVVAGDALDNLRYENLAQREMGGTINPDISIDPHDGKYRKRQIDVAVRLFNLMGIQRGDRQALEAWTQRGFRYFDAPVAIILCVEKWLNRHQAQFTLGCLAENICLAALEFSLATCIHDQGVTYPDAVRKWVPVPESQRIAMAISLGYPDPGFPANRIETPREPLESFVHWVGFDLTTKTDPALAEIWDNDRDSKYD